MRRRPHSPSQTRITQTSNTNQHIDNIRHTWFNMINKQGHTTLRDLGALLRREGRPRDVPPGAGQGPGINTVVRCDSAIVNSYDVIIMCMWNIIWYIIIYHIVLNDIISNYKSTSETPETCTIRFTCRQRCTPTGIRRPPARPSGVARLACAELRARPHILAYHIIYNTIWYSIL